ncbi:hypothetical protein SKTS_28600 [Sulfurimicrobium lacus]|uniref:Uncharacterized protein n=1 Tax=Sulfurimicrobium lacus TaxID=2715678 RepID=A0A6F8VE63_9PROT|nr:hypothetical protein SKTS_28600 [Sulfurimicrobium lacus]
MQQRSLAVLKSFFKRRDYFAIAILLLKQDANSREQCGMRSGKRFKFVSDGFGFGHHVSQHKFDVISEI